MGEVNLIHKNIDHKLSNSNGKESKVYVLSSLSVVIKSLFVVKQWPDNTVI